MLEVTVQYTQNGGGERVIADRVVYADTPALRRKGVLGASEAVHQKQSLDPDEGVLLAMPPRLGLSLFHSIYMFGVPFELGVAWLDDEGVILDVKRARPGRMDFPSGLLTKTRYILEVHPAHHSLLKKGNRVRWREATNE